MSHVAGEWLKERGITESILSPSVDPEKVFVMLSRPQLLTQQPNGLSLDVATEIFQQVPLPEP